MSLYLKYRPSDFDNLVGQTFVKETLTKAISKDKLVGAYLFCGPRGTGKTSTARIFAKTINCKNTTNGNPCLKCDVCEEFLDERLVDIVEIDAASHTGVDNVREIIEKAQFQPTKTNFKVYIIDEVHMLSKGAFNALLKILEEPPSHVKFILATTETHKVPETIISRCQRYDFKRINDNDIRKRLEFITKQEGISIDDDSMNYIIKNSGGGLRNAISLLEQLIEDNEIIYVRIIEKLGLIGTDVLINFLDKLLVKDSSILTDFDDLLSSGKNIKLFFKELIFFTRDESLKKVKTGDNISSLLCILDILDDTYSKTKNSLDENTTFIIGLLKIVNGYSPLPEQNITENQVKKSNTNKIITNKISEGNINHNKVAPVVSHDDVTDIFGDLSISSSIQEEKQVVSSSNSAFNINEFIDKLKTTGAKGALTMAMRGCSVSLSGDNLHIGAKTKIASGQVTNPDNQVLILKVLSDMGIPNANLNIG